MTNGAKETPQPEVLVLQIVAQAQLGLRRGTAIGQKWKIPQDPATPFVEVECSPEGCQQLFTWIEEQRAFFQEKVDAAETTPEESPPENPVKPAEMEPVEGALDPPLI